jgi:hypothetical protein
VDDALEQVGVVPRRDGLEEVAADDLAPVPDALFPEVCFGRLQAGRQVEDGAAQVRIRPQDRARRAPVPPPTPITLANGVKS